MFDDSDGICENCEKCEYKKRYELYKEYLDYKSTDTTNKLVAGMLIAMIVCAFIIRVFKL